MTSEADPLRPGEVTAPLPDRLDAGLVFIGRIRTPFATRQQCPRQGQADGPECRLELDPPWDAGLSGLEAYSEVEVLYWLHQARRDLVVQSPKSDGRYFGTFALRSPLRPNPIGTSICPIVRVEPHALVVRGLDCLDGTPLIDIKPHRGEFKPQAPSKLADG